jgi:hypothetical protein
MAEHHEQVGNYEERFGNIAVRMDYITLEQFFEALSTQVMEEINEGAHRLIGEVLFDLEYLSTEQIQEILGELQRVN